MSQLRIGDKLGSFRLESVVGSGAMGVVYRGVNDTTGKPAAIKVVAGEISQRGKVYDRFMREAEILKQFRHPNIVRFLAVGRFQGTSYIAMEFIQGETLDKVLEKRGPLPWREVVDLAIQICESLQYAHEHGVVHRDLKPSNLMLTDDGRIKLTDFGIAKDLDATALTATGRTLGTAAYMAPEQIRGTPAVSHKTDLYALGIVLYQLLVGRPPFEGNTPMVLMHNHLNEKPPRPSDKVEEIPVALDELVVALMAKDPGDRPWDAAAVGFTLSELKKKSENGKAVKMVWTGEDASVMHPQRLGNTARGTSGPSSGTSGGSRSARSRGETTTVRSGLVGSLLARETPLLTRGTLEVLGLVSALIAVAGLITYLVWPPGQEYLYQHAKELMASTQRHDWYTARDEYIEPLERRFPNNPYRDETQSWRDKILLEDAEGRSKTLESPVKTALTTPKDNAERLYVITHEVARQASQRHDDLSAIQEWRKLEGELKPNEPEERPWGLLARKRAEDLEHAIQDRRRLVLRQFQLVDEAFRVGRTAEASNLQAKLIQEFGNYTDLADLFMPAAQSGVPTPDSSSAPEPAVKPESPAPNSRTEVPLPAPSNTIEPPKSATPKK